MVLRPVEIKKITMNILRHGLLECKIEKTIEMSISPGMLSTFEIILDMIIEFNSFSLVKSTARIMNTFKNDNTINKCKFYTHWIYNSTGSDLDFWIIDQSKSDIIHEIKDYNKIKLNAENDGYPLNAFKFNTCIPNSTFNKQELEDLNYCNNNMCFEIKLKFELK